MKQSLLDTLKQAREALLNAGSSSYSANQLSEAAANLTAAIAELEKAKPVAWRYFVHDEECFGPLDGYRPEPRKARKWRTWSQLLQGTI